MRGLDADAPVRRQLADLAQTPNSTSWVATESDDGGFPHVVAYCGRTVDQVTHLAQGPHCLFICDICVDACVDTLKPTRLEKRRMDYCTTEISSKRRTLGIATQGPMKILKTEQSATISANDRISRRGNISTTTKRPWNSLFRCFGVSSRRNATTRSNSRSLFIAMR